MTENYDESAAGTNNAEKSTLSVPSREDIEVGEEESDDGDSSR